MTRQNTPEHKGHKRPGHRSHGRPAHGADAGDVRGPSYEAAAKLRVALDEAHYIVFDIETTGGNPERNGITEIFAIKYQRGRSKETFYSLVNPGIPVPPIVRRMTGIDNKMLKDQPRIGEVMPKLVEFLGDDILVSHNTIGDMKFLRYFAEKTTGKTLDNFFLCTHLLVDKLAHEAPDKSLKGLAKHFDLSAANLHRAEADAHVTLALFRVLLDKLAKSNIHTVDQAIRLQGDMDSGMRLGWAVPPGVVDKFPGATGLFRLFDHERRVLFVSSAINLQREVKKLQKYIQLPRHLLRIVLRTYDVQVERFPNSYAALLAECEALKQLRLQSDPVDWHHRAVDCLNLIRAKDQVRIVIGPAQEGAVQVAGPVRDHREALDFVAKVAEVLGAQTTKDGLHAPKELEPALAAFLGGTLDQEVKRLKSSRFSLRVLFDSKRRKAIWDSLKSIEALSKLKVPGETSPLLDISGLIVVPGATGSEHEVYQVAGSRPKNMTVIKGDWEAKLTQAGVGKRMFDSIINAKPHLPLSRYDAARVNATLWWIQTHHSRGEGAFVPIVELRDRLKARTKSQ